MDSLAFMDSLTAEGADGAVVAVGVVGRVGAAAEVVATAAAETCPTHRRSPGFSAAVS